MDINYFRRAAGLSLLTEDNLTDKRKLAAKLHAIGNRGLVGTEMIKQVRKLVPASKVPSIMKCYDAEDNWSEEAIMSALTESYMEHQEDKDLNRFCVLAGLYEKETWFDKQFNSDDDDDMSSSEKELAKKADEELKKKGVSVDKDLSNAEKLAEKKAAEKAAKKKAAKEAAAKEKAEQKPEPKAEEKPAEKAEAPAKSAKKIHQAIEWLKSNSSASRKDFIAHAQSFGMSKAYAGAYFYLLKKRIGNSSVKEAFILLHPSVSRFALAENKQFNRYQWVSLEEHTAIEPLVFDTAAQAEKIVKFINDHKSMDAIVERLSIDK